jgi:hypothetical protein
MMSAIERTSGHRPFGCLSTGHRDVITPARQLGAAKVSKSNSRAKQGQFSRHFKGVFLAILRPLAGHTPIVFVNVADPVGSGFVASLARPGGNITGFTNFEP